MRSTKTLSVMALMVLLFTAAATAIDYGNEHMRHGLTDFEWCFDTWRDGISLKEYWQPYIDNYGCEDVTIDVLYEAKTHNTKYLCVPQEAVCDVGDNDTIECVPQDPVCAWQDVYGTERYSLTSTDLDMNMSGRVCVVGDRKAKLGSQKCDMNFIYDDGEEYIDVADDGKAWLNTTWQLRQSWTVNATSELTNTTEFAHKLVYTNATINYSETADDGSGLRFTDSTGSNEYSYFLEIWNETGESIVYVKILNTNTTNTSGYTYYNTSAPVSTASSFNDTFGSELEGFYPFNQDANDTSDNAFSGAPQGNAQVVKNTTDIIEKRDGEAVFDGVNDRIDTTQTTTFQDTDPLSFGCWVVPAADMSLADNAKVFENYDFGNDYLMLMFRQTDDKWNMQGDDGPTNPPLFESTDVILRGAPTHLFITYDGVQDWNMYLNASTTAGSSVVWNPGQIQPVIPWSIGENAAEDFKGSIDECRVYNGRELSANEVFLLANSPLTSHGARETSVTATDIVTGLFDDSFNNISLTVPFGQEWMPWANYSYDSNSSAVTNLSGYCNWTAANVSEEQVSETGINVSVCPSGCTYTNIWHNFTGLSTGGYIEDVHRIELCRNGSVNMLVQFNDTCGSLFNVSAVILPLCSANSASFDIPVDCGAAASVSFNLTSVPNATGDALFLVNDRRYLDRFHNVTNENMTYNTSGLWHASTLHETYSTSPTQIDISCQGTGIENQTSSFNISTTNVAPEVTISSIWWWLLPAPTLFTTGTIAKYPLQSTINTTFSVSDDNANIDTALCHLNYSNGTNIYTTIHSIGAGIFGLQANLTQGNFSVEEEYLNGTSGYTWQVYANDTEGASTSLQRNFTVQNDRPSASWDNASGQAYTTPLLNFSFTCPDAEEPVLDYYIYLNGTLNASGSGNNSWFINVSEGSYRADLVCNDTLHGSDNDTMLFSYSPACDLQINGMSESDRLRTTTVMTSLNCSNDVNLTECNYSINDFSPEAFACSGENLTLELGRNLIEFSTLSDAGLVATTLVTVYAKKPDVTMADYMLLIVFGSVLAFLLWFGTNKFDVLIVDLVTVAVMGFTAFYLYSMNLWLSLSMWLVTVLYAAYTIFRD